MKPFLLALKEKVEDGSIDPDAIDLSARTMLPPVGNTATTSVMIGAAQRPLTHRGGGAGGGTFGSKCVRKPGSIGLLWRVHVGPLAN